MKRVTYIFAVLGLGAGVASLLQQPSMAEDQLPPELTQPYVKVATFAGGCFWCVEADYEKVDGVLEAISGYSGGKIENPNYKQVAGGETRHLEAVQVYYDSRKLSYDDMLNLFWRMVDPTDKGGQFVDRGYQYSTAIFFHGAEQQAAAKASIETQQASGRYDKPIVTQLRPFIRFYEAEDYHQDYWSVNPIRYKYYRYRSGRDQYLETAWGDDLKYTPVGVATASMTSAAVVTKGFNKETFMKPDDSQLKQQLSGIQYEVTQHEGTERPYQNAYWDEKRAGIYVDIVSGEPLFSSIDKYDSGTGWPSFTQPLDTSNIVTKKDYKLLLPRTEVRSKHADSHLGHVFEDGPKPTGLRYCINSASLRFIPVDELEEAGYGEFASLFQ